MYETPPPSIKISDGFKFSADYIFARKFGKENPTLQSAENSAKMFIKALTGEPSMNPAEYLSVRVTPEGYAELEKLAESANGKKFKIVKPLTPQIFDSQSNKKRIIVKTSALLFGDEGEMLLHVYSAREKGVWRVFAVEDEEELR